MVSTLQYQIFRVRLCVTGCQGKPFDIKSKPVVAQDTSGWKLQE